MTSFQFPILNIKDSDNYFFFGTQNYSTSLVSTKTIFIEIGWNLGSESALP